MLRGPLGITDPLASVTVPRDGAEIRPLCQQGVPERRRGKGAK